MSLELVRDRFIRLDLLGLRWAWAIANYLRLLGHQTERRSWTVSRSSPTASSRRTIGMATVTPEMVAEASVAAGWPPVMTLHEAAEAMRISPRRCVGMSAKGSTRSPSSGDGRCCSGATRYSASS